MFITNNDMI